ncbi:cobalamin-dependent protein [uncultured Desulfosarcina sp.]|uniref:cobalamin-dependent protein n=1 Tax=uncultured Desulfosarcina sp. TaxID=218289 RepID=UPI0029C9959E|nr:cobalamin-dependent protein [uncultured Desulfosarcina sp.]
MNDGYKIFHDAVGETADGWLKNGLPSRQVLEESAARLLHLRQELKIPGLWEHPPCMVTATLDDGLGQGLGIIEKFAAAIGIRLISLGLLQPAAAIVDACRDEKPDFLGMTILQFDTEEELTAIAGQLPKKTRIVAGGPAFTGDPDFADRTGTHYAARNVAAFLRFMLDDAASRP